ncbi:MAG TPA: SAM-dependent methyltransferase, partial [Armatimonadetes bacterium]|nr:SAM-dependent methyltransferase [Armatimonadota bacterium]
MDIDQFISKWERSAGSEQGNSQTYLGELCEVLEVEKPRPTTGDPARDAYVFERGVDYLDDDGARRRWGRIDLYKRDCFVLESKQGRRADDGTLPGERQARPGMDAVLERARAQAKQYIAALDRSIAPPPPFIIICDVGATFDLYAEFTRTGGEYTPYPDARAKRIRLGDLRDPDNLDLLRTVWTDPAQLDPSRQTAQATRALAGRLAELSRELEADHSPDSVADFLMRCLFTMFVEDVGLLPGSGFTGLLASLQDRPPEVFVRAVEELWRAMKTGGWSASLLDTVLHFNGPLFANPTALPLTPAQAGALLEAAEADWQNVDPAIFGSLLERALDPRERHKLGAHYTPRAYVERLIEPTVIAPLRAEWEAAQAAAYAQSDPARAVELLRRFHQRLCTVRVLDPACGSGNFLYVTLEGLKRLENDVVAAREQYGDHERGLTEIGTVGPAQLLGLEVNPRAAAIASLVVWIGYLQWHRRTYGAASPPEPVLDGDRYIDCRDAVLTWRERRIRLENGQPVTRWDGHTTIKHPTTGLDVPDENARELVYDYLDPQPAEWPQADYVVGNPPFMGIAMMRAAFGDGYTEALRAAYPDVADSTDLVMYWWHKAAGLLREGRIRRFGFITTNSIAQTFSRRVVAAALAGEPPVSLAFAIPDHPWVDAAEGAAVRIAMTVAQEGHREGTLATVTAEEKHADGDEARAVTFERVEGVINADLTVGVDVTGIVALQSNRDLANRGVCLFGDGFIVTPELAAELGLGTVPGIEQHIRNYRNGKDITDTSRGVLVIDLFGLTAEQVRDRYPAVYQHVVEYVKPRRDHNARKVRRENWWLFGETNPKLREMLAGLPRYIATPETAKHRFFVFLDESILPDNMLVNIALDDAYYLGVLSSRWHVTWALASGGTLEDRPRYTKTRCFDPFPFPAADEGQRGVIRELAERLHGHRVAAQAAGVTLTQQYNALAR